MEREIDRLSFSGSAGHRYLQGKIEIDPMITHTMPLSEINAAFDLMRQGKSIRSVVVY